MLPPEFWQGVDQFNQRQFYACHDTLEAIWMEAGTDKQFYQGILQVAVGLYHLGNNNWRGAVILLGEGSNRLQSYTPSYEGVDVENFLEQTIALLRRLQETGAEGVSALKQQLGYGEVGYGEVDRASDPTSGLPSLPILRSDPGDQPSSSPKFLAP